MLKKTNLICLILAFMFSLCACENADSIKKSEIISQDQSSEDEKEDDESSAREDDTEESTDNESTEEEKESTPCSHMWIDATCTTPKKCSKCGETEGVALGHSCDIGKCSRCGEIAQTSDKEMDYLTSNLKKMHINDDLAGKAMENASNTSNTATRLSYIQEAYSYDVKIISLAKETYQKLSGKKLSSGTRDIIDALRSISYINLSYPSSLNDFSVDIQSYKDIIIYLGKANMGLIYETGESVLN